MSDPDDYILVRMDNNIHDKAILSYDAAKDMIVDSGLHGSLGELKSAASTVSVGVQDVSSAGEQVVFRNAISGISYAPPWHIIDETNMEGSRDRLYDAMQTAVRFSDRSAELENPSFAVHIPNNELVFSLNMNFPEVRDNVVLEVLLAGQQIWRELITTDQGDSDYYLKEAIAFYPGDYVFRIRPYGDINLEPPVKVMGNPQTGEVGYSVNYREFREVPLATQEYVNAAISGGPSDALMLKAVYDTDNDGVVDEAKEAEAIKSGSIAGNWKYYGTDGSGSLGFHAVPSIDSNHPALSSLQAQITYNTDEIVKLKKSVSDHEVAITNHGNQLSANANGIKRNSNNVDLALKSSKAALTESQTVRSNMIRDITANVDHATKVITLTLTSNAGVIGTSQIDLSSWFQGGTSPQPGVTHKLYYGFVSIPPMDEAEILRLSTGTKTVDKLEGTEIVLSRQDSTPKYMYVWIPDSAGTPKGFTFSNFLSVWHETQITVAGVPGKFYHSPNRTAARSVTFEVTV